MPAVIDARLRHRLGSLVPLPSRPWSAQVPAIADPERRAYVTVIAALMDARKDRIGEHAELTPTAGHDIPEAAQWIKDLATGRRTFAERLAALTTGT